MTRNACRRIAGVFAMVVLLGMLSVQVTKAQAREFNVPAQSATTGIPEFARQAGIQILVSEPLVRGKQIAAVMGPHSVEEALAILLKGTGLTASSKDGATYTVAVASAAPSTSGIDSSNTKEAGKSSSQDFRVAQVDQGAAGPQVGNDHDSEKKKKEEGLTEIVVTGSHLTHTTQETAQEVHIYSRAQIDQSGQSSIGDFLNTLPEVSRSSTENQYQNFGGATTVNLHGLPSGTTLVLLNGRRLETSGAQAISDFFDLNNIPMAAVERIEVVPSGSSAIYGSDALAGVVNVILKKDLEGAEADVRYGSASDISETNASVGLGKLWDEGSASLIATYQSHGDLLASKRVLTATSNYARFGGFDNPSYNCPRSNIFSGDGVTPLPGLGSATYAAVPSGYTGTPSIAEFLPTAGNLNTCGQLNGADIIGNAKRFGALFQAQFHLTNSIDLFLEVPVAHTEQSNRQGYAYLYAYPGSPQQFTASANNPYNPFGVDVGVGIAFTNLTQRDNLATTFVRPLIGARGAVFGDWTWETTVSQSGDRTKEDVENDYVNSITPVAVQAALSSTNPATALNPFTAGPAGSPTLIKSFFSDVVRNFSGKSTALNGILRGPVLNLPAGPLQAVVGAEYSYDELSYDASPFTFSTSRHNQAIFAETRIPILGQRNVGDGDALAVSAAGRYDHSSDFGGKATPQFGVELRPIRGLLLRGSYARSYKAPSLYFVHLPTIPQQTVVTDPVLNQNEQVSFISGGNAHLRPITGTSKTFGFVFTNDALPGVQLAVTHWSIEELNNIQPFLAATIVANENLFPGAVVRAPGQNGQVGVITQINGTYQNFGQIRVSGIDYDLMYKASSRVGTWSPSIHVTQTYRYEGALVAGAPATNRVSVATDDNDWAPRWKGVASLGWSLGPIATVLSGRYVGKYQDYDSTQMIGNFWLCDLNVRYALRQAFESQRSWLRGTSLDIGAVNLLNKLPQFSNYQGDYIGYDPAEGDIRGRFIYANVRVAF